MFDKVTLESLRPVLAEVCDGIGPQNSGVRIHVASAILKAAREGRNSEDALRVVGRQALDEAPTMWR